MQNKYAIRSLSVSNRGLYPLTQGGKRTKCYSVWYSMHDRCYAEKQAQLAYQDCTVHPSWFYFQTFAVWFRENYIPGFQLDKDILIKGNKEYGPDACVFVPQELNCFFTDSRNTRGGLPQGVSLVSTPTLKYQAHLSKKGKIDERTYKALIEWKL